MLCLSLSIRAVIRALCTFLSCSRVHFIYAYCTVFNERINDEDRPIRETVVNVLVRRSQSSWSCWYLTDGCGGRLACWLTPSSHWLHARVLSACSRCSPHILLLAAAVFAQLSFRNSFQLNDWSDLRVSCCNRYSASNNVIELQSAHILTAILDAMKYSVLLLDLMLGDDNLFLVRVVRRTLLPSQFRLSVRPSVCLSHSSSTRIEEFSCEISWL